MPIMECSLDGGGKGFKWGESGKCYASREDAVKQGVAIRMREGTYKVAKGHHSSGVMVALKMPEEIAKSVKANHPQAEKTEDLHVTLAYLGKAEKMKPEQLRRAAEITKEVAERHAPLTAKLAGQGRFRASDSSDGKDVMYANFDAPALDDLRYEVVSELKAAGIPVSKKHGYTPHVTMAYLDPGEESPDLELPEGEFPIDCVTFNIGEDALDFPLGQAEEEEPEEQPSDSDLMALEALGVRVVSKEAPWIERQVEIVAKEEGGEGHLVYGVVYEPNAEDLPDGGAQQTGTEDLDDDVMTPLDVQFAAHHFLAVKGVMGYRHRKLAGATVVESYIAPCDFQCGDQLVKKGSWVLVTRIDDPELWGQIERGEINGYSVGGYATAELLGAAS